MKKIILSMSLLAATGMVHAKAINSAEAKLVGQNFLNSQSSARYGIQLNPDFNTKYVKNTSTPAFYIFNATSGKGFVIVSADDKVTPILGYSTESNLPATNNSPEVTYWLDNYSAQIGYAIAHNRVPLPAVQESWKAYGVDYVGGTASKPTGVAPIMNTLWNQDPYYNQLCPTNTPTGCVATAMAQIMKFWSHPTTGTGSHSYSTSTNGGTLSANFGATTYDWANMPLSLTSSSTAVQKTAIATLMFHCGVSVDMDYAPGGSGSQVIDMGQNWACAENSFKTYFGYKSTIKGYSRDEFTDTTWIKMLKFEINTGRPVLYAGFGQVGGHAFDFDGYDDNGKFHINWGWGGMSNGYFVVDDLSPSALGTGAGSGNFNYGQQALVMIEPANSVLPPNPYTPDNNGNNNDYNLALNAAIISSADTIFYKDPYSVSAEVINNGSQDFSNGVLAILAINADQSNGALLTGEQLTITAGGTYNIQYITASDTDMTPDTYYIGICSAPSVSNLNFMPVDDGQNTNEVVLTVLPKTPTSIKDVDNAANIKTYPNPSKDYFNLTWSTFKGSVQSVSLVDIAGSTIFEQKTENVKQCRIPLVQYANGTYFLRIQTDKGTITKKMTINK